MKCHAGVEFESGKPCPKCKAGLGEVCWPGINNDLAELVQLKAAVREFIDAEAAVEAEAKRAEANGGKGWSSAPVVRRLYAVAGLAKFAASSPLSPSNSQQPEIVDASQLFKTPIK